jgi:molybdate transport system regulatory protein
MGAAPLDVQNLTSAMLVLRKGARAQAGGERIALLEAIRDQSSIAAAAKVASLSYKGAWDAVQALNNLFDRPLVETQVGGSRGGFARVTPEGEAVIAAYRAVEGELSHLIRNLERKLSDPNSAPLQSLFWSLAMKTSARNALRGVVDRIVDGAVNAEVVLKIASGAEIVAIITRQSVTDLGLTAGRDAIALIASNLIILAQGQDGFRTSARNTLSGTVARIERGAVNDEVTLQIADGKSLIATITHQSATDLALTEGIEVLALIKASHVILAVE